MITSCHYYRECWNFSYIKAARIPRGPPDSAALWEIFLIRHYIRLSPLQNVRKRNDVDRESDAWEVGRGGMTYVLAYETGKWTVPRCERVNNERAEEADEEERVTISVHLCVSHAYLDKVPARNRFKSKSMPTMKGVKRRCTSALVAIKRSSRCVRRRRKRGRKKENSHAARRHRSLYDRAFRRASTRLLWVRTRDMIGA